MIHDGKTIIACSSSNKEIVAIAVIRISGDFNLLSLQASFSKNLSNTIPRTMYKSFFIDKSEKIDEICFCYFKNPMSFTGENLLELYVHGNPLNVSRIIRSFIHCYQFRHALPGEFSFRALLNKKLTLSQVEGLDLFLHAQTPLALQQGISIYNGQLQQRYLKLLDLFKAHKGAIELMIDFSDDIGEENGNKLVRESFEAFFCELSDLFKLADTPNSQLLSPEIVLIGPPNSGKSTLFNYLVRSPRSIVSSRAGTTRDYISEYIQYEGVNYKLLDTAGIRYSDDDIESEGIALALHLFKNSFFKIFLWNPQNIFNADDFLSLKDQEIDYLVLTHIDLCTDQQILQAKYLIESYFNCKSFITINLQDASLVLWDQLFSSINNKYLSKSLNEPILVERQKNVISDAYADSIAYKQKISTESDMAVLTLECQALNDCLSELIGIVSANDVLDNIFSNFCIGK